MTRIFVDGIHKAVQRLWVSNAVIISNTQAIVALRRECRVARASNACGCSSQPVYNTAWLVSGCD